MKSLLAPLVAGALAGCVLYGILAAASREVPEPEDPWLDAWVAAGQKAEFRTLSGDPKEHLLFKDGRALCDDPAFYGTILRNYILQNGSAQVVRLPKPALLPELDEGRHLDFKLKEKGGGVHYCRVGRTILFVAREGKWVPFVGNAKTPKREVERLFDGFEDAARRYP